MRTLQRASSFASVKTHSRWPTKWQSPCSRRSMSANPSISPNNPPINPSSSTRAKAERLVLVSAVSRAEIVTIRISDSFLLWLLSTILQNLLTVIFYWYQLFPMGLKTLKTSLKCRNPTLGKFWWFFPFNFMEFEKDKYYISGLCRIGDDDKNGGSGLVGK